MEDSIFLALNLIDSLWLQLIIWPAHVCTCNCTYCLFKLLKCHWRTLWGVNCTPYFVLSMMWLIVFMDFNIYKLTTMRKGTKAPWIPGSQALDCIWTGWPSSWFRASVYIIKKWPQQDLCWDAQGQNQTALTRHWAIRTRLHVWVCSCCTLRFLRVAVAGCRILCWDGVVAFLNISLLA